MIAPKTIDWTRLSHKDLQERCNSVGNHFKNGVYACSIWNTTTNICHVFTLNTLKRYSSAEQYVLGHETMHCFEGKFHN